MYSLKDPYYVLKQQLQQCILSNLPCFFRIEVLARRYHSFQFNYQLGYLLGCRHVFIQSESVFWWRHLQPPIFSMVLLLFRGNILSSRCVHFKTPIASIHYIEWTGFTSRTTAQKSNFSIRDFFSKCDQIRSFLQIWSYLLKKPLMVNFICVQWKFEGHCVYLRKAIAAPTFLRYLFFPQN